MWRLSTNHSFSLRWAIKTAPWEFQTKLLHYFFTSNNKSNLHFSYMYIHIHVYIYVPIHMGREIYTDNLNACKHTYKGRHTSNCTAFQKIWCCAFLSFLLRTKSLREQWNKCETTEFAYYHTSAHQVQPSQPSGRTHMANANALENTFASCTFFF